MKLLKNHFFKHLPIILLYFIGVNFLLISQTAIPAENFPRDNDHKGIIDLEPYQIYPEKRIGNGIYLEKKLLETHPERMITNIIGIKNTKSSVYLYKNKKGDQGLDIIKNEEDGDARFWKIDAEFYQYNNRTTGLQRVFRIFENNIKPLLTNVRTGRGVTTSNTHAVFYHIIDSKEITITNENGQEITQRNYTFRLHVINRKFENLKSIFNLIIKDTNYNLKLSWENDSSISYTLSNGTKRIVDLREYVPNLF